MPGIGIPNFRPMGFRPSLPPQGVEPAALPSAMGDAAAGGFQAPPVNVGMKFPVPPFMQNPVGDPALSGFGMSNVGQFQNVGPGLARAQSPPTTYGFSSGNPGQLSSDANRGFSGSIFHGQNPGYRSSLEDALRISFGQQGGGF